MDLASLALLTVHLVLTEYAFNVLMDYFWIATQATVSFVLLLVERAIIIILVIFVRQDLQNRSSLWLVELMMQFIVINASLAILTVKHALFNRIDVLPVLMDLDRLVSDVLACSL